MSLAAEHRHLDALGVPDRSSRGHLPSLDARRRRLTTPTTKDH